MSYWINMNKTKQARNGGKKSKVIEDRKKKKGTGGQRQEGLRDGVEDVVIMIKLKTFSDFYSDSKQKTIRRKINIHTNNLYIQFVILSN